MQVWAMHRLQEINRRLLARAFSYLVFDFQDELYFLQNRDDKEIVARPQMPIYFPKINLPFQTKAC
jgi:hypothetical protein